MSSVISRNSTLTTIAIGCTPVLTTGTPKPTPHRFLPGRWAPSGQTHSSWYSLSSHSTGSEINIRHIWETRTWSKLSWVYSPKNHSETRFAGSISLFKDNYISVLLVVSVLLIPNCLNIKEFNISNITKWIDSLSISNLF